MDDTPPHIEKLMREKLMARSGEERFIMGALMFDAARTMILASLPPDLPEDELKRQLYQRIYGEPLPPFAQNEGLLNKEQK
ncbi:MAG: hypothetical protein JO316_08565 [Abitibacteriaceae bacterium]|nr:hypothetical protein [Abditibacteriaceae bacterium]